LTRTTQGVQAPTPGYAPFEQYGQEPTDERSDVYALGATIYTLYTGRVPIESIARVSGKSLPPPRNINPAISPQIENTILQAMELMPERRFETISLFKDALASPQQVTTTTISAPRNIVTQPHTALVTPDSDEIQGTVTPRSNYKILVGALIALVVIAVVIAVSFALGVVSFSMLSNKPSETTSPIIGNAIMPPITTVPATFTQSALIESPTSTLVPSPISTETAPSVIPTEVEINDWTLSYWVPLSSGCEIPDKPCWKLNDDYNQHLGMSNLILLSKDPIFIDPNYKNPCLFFSNKWDLPRDASVNIEVDGSWRQVLDLGKSQSSFWKQVSIELKPFNAIGKNILIQFSATGKQGNLSSYQFEKKATWFVQDVRILPECTLP
jgi:serine/threonine protein kinase